MNRMKFIFQNAGIVLYLSKCVFSDHMAEKTLANLCWWLCVRMERAPAGAAISSDAGSDAGAPGACHTIHTGSSGNLQSPGPESSHI